MAKGRPRKSGTRTKSGRLTRAGHPGPVFDRGSEWVQARRARFGEHYASAIGRAFASGALGEAQEASDRLQAGKRFARLHSAIIAGIEYRCPLNREQSSSGCEVWDALERQERDMESQAWLFDAMDKLDRAGLRPWLDQLISTMWTDHGPPWLDRLLDGGRHFGDIAMLDAAIKALDVIAPKRRPMGILVAA